MLTGLQTKRVTTLEHVHGAESKAQYIVFTGLPRALPVALTIDELLIRIACNKALLTWMHAGVIMVHHTIWTDWSADIALCDCEGRWALWVPVIFTLLAVMALFSLSIATPK